jgi:hypothetical protein
MDPQRSPPYIRRIRALFPNARLRYNQVEGKQDAEQRQTLRIHHISRILITRKSKATLGEFHLHGRQKVSNADGSKDSCTHRRTSLPASNPCRTQQHGQRGVVPPSVSGQGRSLPVFLLEKSGPDRRCFPLHLTVLGFALTLNYFSRRTWCLSTPLSGPSAPSSVHTLVLPGRTSHNTQ